MDNAAEGGQGLISNTGNGTIFITGGSTDNSNGISSNADKKGAKGTISNTGDGKLVISGRSPGSFGINSNSFGTGSQGLITNTGKGTLSITGGAGNNSHGLLSNADNDGQGTISNTGEGRLDISGGSGLRSYGISRNQSEKAQGIITNTGKGILTINGGSGRNTYGLGENNGTISNTGAGDLLISGGSALNASGIYVNMSGGTGLIRNESNGTLTIQGGTVSSAYGIDVIASGPDGVGTISNGANGTLNLLGNKAAGSFAIRRISEVPPIASGNSGTIENSGTMNLNANAIQSFASVSGNASVTNLSSGKVFAEAGALFSGNYSSTTGETTITPKDIVVWAGDTTTTVQTEKFADVTTTAGTSGTVTLKDDWKYYSHWEDGGQITFTDVVNGSDVAKQITTQFQSAFGHGTAIYFTGTGSGSGSGGQAGNTDFTLEAVNDLKANSKLADGHIVTSEALKGTGALSANTTLAMNTGFKGVTGFSSVAVDGNRTFTLVGEAATMVMALRATEAAATYQLSDAPVTVECGSTLNFGIEKLSATQGILADLTLADNGNLSVEHGIFEVTDLKGNGEIKVKKESTLTVGKYSGNRLTNAGVANFKTDVSLKRPGPSVSTTDVDPGQTKASSTAAFINESKGEANFQNLSLAAGASVENNKDGTINAKDVTVQAGALLWNKTGGSLKFDNLTVLGSIRDFGTTTIGETLNLVEGTNTTLSGKMTAKTLSVGRKNDAMPMLLATGDAPSSTVTVANETYADELDFVSGAVTVQKGATLAGACIKNGLMNAAVKVDAGATFGFSYNENQLKNAVKGLKVSHEGKALAMLNRDLSFGSDGTLTIGTTETTATYNLGSDALLVLDVENLHGKAALTGKDGQTIKVDEGAQMALTAEGMWGNHYLVSGFESSGRLGNLTVFDKDGKRISTKSNAKGLFITVGSDNILDKDAAFGLSDNGNKILDGMQDTASDLADVRFLSKAVAAKNGAAAARDLENLTAHSGLLTETTRLTQNAHESVMDQAYPVFGNGLWAKGLYSKGSAEGFSASRGDSSSYDIDTYGFAMGGDVRFGNGWGAGLAGHYQRGKTDASITENDLETYGVSAYGVKRFDSGLGIAAGVTWAKGSGEITQKNLEYVTADADAETLIVGGKAFYDAKAGEKVTVSPYAGLEAVRTKAESYTAQVAGQEAFHFGSASETFWRVPVGVRATYAGDAFEGFADVSVTPQFGNKDTEQSVSGLSVKGRDNAAFTFADDYVGKVRVGAAYRMGSTVFSAGYGATVGSDRGLTHDLSVRATFVF